MRIRIYAFMGPIEHIRREILNVSQAEFARIAQVTQPTVSRWERGDLEPSRVELGRIRDAVAEQGLPWSDAWFFEAPSVAPDDSAQQSDEATS